MKLKVIKVENVVNDVTNLIAKSKAGFAIRLASEKPVNEGDEIDLPEELMENLPKGIDHDLEVPPPDAEESENEKICLEFKVQDMEQLLKRQNIMLRRLKYENETLKKKQGESPVRVADVDAANLKE